MLSTRWGQKWANAQLKWEPLQLDLAGVQHAVVALSCFVADFERKIDMSWIVRARTARIVS
jgi:hypothetical protein